MIQIKTTKKVEQIIEIDAPKFLKKEYSKFNYEVIGIFENDRAIRLIVIGDYINITNGNHKDMETYMPIMLDGTEIAYEEFKELLLLATLHIQHNF